MNIARVQTRDAGKLESTTVNGIAMIETIKASDAENGFFQKWAGYQASVNKQRVRSLKNELMTGCDPATALKQVNLQLSEHNSSAMFVTVWLTVLEISTGKGMVCNAGHENPCIRRADGEFELLEYSHDMFVGGMKKAKYRNREFELHPGDCLFVYTDGVPEATNADNEMFGEQRLIHVLNQNADADPEGLIHRVHEAVNRLAGDAPQFDDITMLCYKHNAERSDLRN